MFEAPAAPQQSHRDRSRGRIGGWAPRLRKSEEKSAVGLAIGNRQRIVVADLLATAIESPQEHAEKRLRPEENLGPAFHHSNQGVATKNVGQFVGKHRAQARPVQIGSHRLRYQQSGTDCAHHHRCCDVGREKDRSGNFSGGTDLSGHPVPGASRLICGKRDGVANQLFHGAQPRHQSNQKEDTAAQPEKEKGHSGPPPGKFSRCFTARGRRDGRCHSAVPGGDGKEGFFCNDGRRSDGNVWRSDAHALRAINWIVRGLRHCGICASRLDQDSLRATRVPNGPPSREESDDQRR